MYTTSSSWPAQSPYKHFWITLVHVPGTDIHRNVKISFPSFSRWDFSFRKNRYLPSISKSFVVKSIFGEYELQVFKLTCTIPTAKIVSTNVKPHQSKSWSSWFTCKCMSWTIMPSFRQRAFHYVMSFFFIKRSYGHRSSLSKCKESHRAIQLQSCETAQLRVPTWQEIAQACCSSHISIYDVSYWRNCNIPFNVILWW